MTQDSSGHLVMGRSPAVFLSHSSLDKEAANLVCRVLEQSGIQCWIAPRDIPAADSWDDAIIRGINACAVMVLIFSSHANESDQVKKELHLALTKKKKVIPLRIEEVRPADQLEYILTAVHWLDAFEPPLESRLEPLIERVKQIVESSAPPKPVPAPGPVHTAAAVPVPGGLRVALLYKRNAQPDEYVLRKL